MSEDEMIDLLKEISVELTGLKRYIRILARDAVSSMLNKAATTPERQQMWRLADGSHSNEEIANQISASLRSVQYFVQEAENAGLIIMEKRGYPKRIEDIIPPEWKSWKPKQTKAEPQPSVITEEKLDVQG